MDFLKFPKTEKVEVIKSPKPPKLLTSPRSPEIDFYDLLFPNDRRHFEPKPDLNSYGDGINRGLARQLPIKSPVACTHQRLLQEVMDSKEDAKKLAQAYSWFKDFFYRFKGLFGYNYESIPMIYLSRLPKGKSALYSPSESLIFIDIDYIKKSQLPECVYVAMIHEFLHSVSLLKQGSLLTTSKNIYIHNHLGLVYYNSILSRDEGGGVEERIIGNNLNECVVETLAIICAIRGYLRIDSHIINSGYVRMSTAMLKVISIIRQTLSEQKESEFIEILFESLFSGSPLAIRKFFEENLGVKITLKDLFEVNLSQILDKEEYAGISFYSFSPHPKLNPYFQNLPSDKK